jgi:Ran GTPase-activating protein (RanGAP) involved in mRNA processing and transport
MQHLCFQSQSLKYLDISSMNIDKKSAHSLSQSLSLATSLQTLMMDSCNLSPAVLDMLSGDIRNSISLHDMSLRGNNFSKKAFPPLSSILYSPIELPQDVGCTGLISLDLSGNDLRYGARLLANALAQNNQLQSLILRNCQLDSTLLAPLAEAIVSTVCCAHEY